MGFELDRLMKQFGVSTPSLNYSGTGVPIDPGARPVATTTLTGDALTSAQAGYDNLLAKYNIDKANYPADQALYNTYKSEYQNRLLGTPQYMQAQFQTGYEPKSAGYQWATRPDVNADTGSGMGVKQFNQNIQNWASSNPTANTAAINAYADKYGLNAQDIYNATNNRWGNTLQVPKYGTATPDLDLITPVTGLVCGVGMKPNADGTACIPITTGGGGGLVCGVGMTPNADGTACVPITTGGLVCGEFMKPNAAGTACIPNTVEELEDCPTGMTRGPDGVTCVPIVEVEELDPCPTGMTRGPDGVTCVPIVEELEPCPTGMTRGADGITCVPIIDELDPCPTGMTRGPDGITCVPIVEKPDGCPTGMTLGPDGVTCVPIIDKPDGCPAGMTLGADGVTCVPIIDTPAACGLGMVRNAQGECVPIVVDETIIGGTGNDTIVGGTGNDTVVGGTGNDTIVGAGGNDTVVGAGGNDTVVGGTGNDSILTTLSTVTGGAGNDTITGGTANDTITGATNNDSILNTLSTITGGATNDVISDDGTTSGILNTIAALNGTTGTSSVTGASGNDVVADDGTTSSILNTIADLNRTAGNSAVTGTTGNDLVSDDGTSDSILNTIAELNGTSGNNAVTGATSVDSVTGLDTTGNGAGTGLSSDFVSATDLGNGLYSVANGDGTYNIVTEDGVSMGSVGGGLEAVQDWEGNRVLTGIPNVTVQAPDDTALHYYPEGAEQIERYNNWLNSLKGGDAGASAFMGSTGDIANRYDDGFSAFSGGGGGGGLGKYMDDYSSAAYAKGGQVKTHYNNGGRVKTHFQTGGANQASDIEQMAENYGVAPQPDMMSYQGSKLFPMQGQAPAPVSNQMTRRDAYPPTPQSPMDARASQLDALLQRYAGNTTDYSAELAEARKTANTESMAFQKMIQEAMKGSADAAPSKAEMYFRLASAFGSPTKTGHFAESLGNVNKELASYSKEERDAKKAQRALQMQMGLEGQKMRMASAKDELATIRTLAAEGMKDKRAITAEVIKDFIKSGEPESAAGKQAKDEGLKPGTKEFQARVNEIAQTSVDAKLAQVTATLAGMSVQQANATLAMSKFENQKAQQSKLTPAEVTLRTQTEDIIGSTEQAMNDLRRAYALNPNTFDASLPDTAQRKLLEAAGSKDPKLANTREQINLLEKGALAQLKSTFPGAISDAETRTLKELQGINAKSIEERGRIMKNAFRALKAIEDRNKRRLNDIKQGVYRDTSPEPEGLE